MGDVVQLAKQWELAAATRFFSTVGRYYGPALACDLWNPIVINFATQIEVNKMPKFSAALAERCQTL